MAADWTSFAHLVFVFAAVVVPGNAVLLISRTYRQFFEWPTRWLGVNYLLAAVAVLCLQFGAYAAVAAVDQTGLLGVPERSAFLRGAFAANFLVPAACLVPGVLRLRGREDWPTDRGGGVPVFAVVWYGLLAWIATITYAILAAVGTVAS